MNKNIVIAILILIVLCLGGYLIYDKVIDKKDSVCVNDDGESENNNSDEKTNNIQILEFSPDSVAVVYNGEAYVNVYGSTLEIDRLYGEGTFQTLMNTRNEKYKEYNIEALKILNSMNQNFRCMKLDISNVKSIYSYAYGQALSPNYGIFILKNDGTVYGISLYSLISGKTNLTQISSLSNIVDFKSENNAGSGYATYAIDENGNKYNMQEYIPQNYNEW